jgi:hypothetical protein
MNTVVLLIRTRWDRTQNDLFLNLQINIFQKTPYVFINTIYIQIQNVFIYNFTLHIIIVIIQIYMYSYLQEI